METSFGSSLRKLTAALAVPSAVTAVAALAVYSLIYVGGLRDKSWWFVALMFMPLFGTAALAGTVLKGVGLALVITPLLNWSEDTAAVFTVAGAGIGLLLLSLLFGAPIPGYPQPSLWIAPCLTLPIVAGALQLLSAPAGRRRR